MLANCLILASRPFALFNLVLSKSMCLLNFRFLLRIIPRYLFAGNSNNQAKLRIGEIALIKDDKPRLLWHKGKINRFLESRDGKVRGTELVVFQPKAFMINRPIQQLIPSEVSDSFEEEIDLESENESAKEDDRCLRIAAQNADLIRNFQNH